MIARGFVENGAKVYISSRSASVCASVAKELNQIGNGGSCISIPADLSKEEEAKRLIAQIQKNELRKRLAIITRGSRFKFESF